MYGALPSAKCQEEFCCDFDILSASNTKQARNVGLAATGTRCVTTVEDVNNGNNKPSPRVTTITPHP